MKAMIVTGASSGIGRAVALAAAQEDFALVAVGRRTEMLEEVSQQIHAAGGLCTTVPVDLRSPNAASAIVSTAIQRYERIDAIVHAAGTAAAGSLLAQSDPQLAEQWEIHVLAPLRLTREALTPLRATHGQIFLFGSGVAAVPTPGLGAYPPMKAAVRAMATQLRRELHDDDIAVTYVDPGAVDTPLMERARLRGPAKRLRISAERRGVAHRALAAFPPRSAERRSMAKRSRFAWRAAAGDHRSRAQARCRTSPAAEPLPQSEAEQIEPMAPTHQAATACDNARSSARAAQTSTRTRASLARVHRVAARAGHNTAVKRGCHALGRNAEQK